MADIVLREYQDKAVGNSIDAMFEHQLVLLQAATGSGKTIIAAAIIDWARKINLRCYFFAPRRELVYQAADKMELFGYQHGYDYGIYMAGEESAEELKYVPLQIASKDTLMARMRSGRTEMPRADLVIVDEAHLSLAPTWMQLIKEFEDQGAMVLGMTATPARADGRGLGQLYNHMVKCPSVQELMDMGHLCSDVKYYAPSPPDLETLKFDRKKNDYTDESVSRLMSQPKIVGDIVSNWMRVCYGKRTIMFCAGVKHSILVRDEFLKQGVPAAHIDANTDSDERKEIFEKVRTGEILVLCNCLIATYGTDLPETEVIGLARPTLSITMHLQMIGRGLRPFGYEDGTTKYLIVMDHAGNLDALGYAHDEINWTLDDDKNIAKEVAQRQKDRKEDREGITCGGCSLVYEGSRACPECEWEPPEKRGKDIIVNDGDLEEQTGKSKKKGKKKKAEPTMEEIQDFYLRTKGLLEGRKNGKVGQAYYITKSKFKNVDIPFEWKDLPSRQPNKEVIGYEKYTRIRRSFSRR